MAFPVSDRLFRYSFSSPENARDLAHNLLPPRYHHLVEEARVTVDSKSYIEAELREQLTDLLIRFDRPPRGSTHRAAGAAHATDSSGGPARRANRKRGQKEKPAALYLYVLVEHKSQPEHWTTFQLLRYMLAVWSDVLRREGPELQRLPPILPVVLYQGTREWNSPRSFEALVESAGEEVPGERPAMHIPRHIPRFEPLFVNLQSLPDKHFHGGVRAVVARRRDRHFHRRSGAQAVL